MVGAREALVDGGLSAVDRPRGGGGGTALADRVVKPRGRRPSKKSTSGQARRNALSERAVGGRLDIRPARPEVTVSQRAICFELVGQRRPELPVRSIVGGRIVAGLEMTRERDGDGWLISCPSQKHWTRNLALTGFPEGLVVTVYGPNAIMVRPAPLPEAAPYRVTTAGVRA